MKYLKSINESITIDQVDQTISWIKEKIGYNQVKDISNFTPNGEKWGSIDVFGTLWVDFGYDEISNTQRFVDNLRDMIEKKSGLTEKEIDELIIPQKSSVGLGILLEFTIKDKGDN